MSAEMPWTTAMMAVLEDGEWHDREDVLQAGISVIPEERALEEMGERSMTSTPERRVSAGARTVAQQALQGRRRFGAVEYSSSKPIRVRKTGHDGVSIGHVAERVDRLEEELGVLRSLVGVLSARLGVEEPVPTGDDGGQGEGVVLDLVNRINGNH